MASWRWWPGDGLVEGDRRRLGPAALGRLVQVHVVLAGTAAVGRRGSVVGGGRVGRQVLRHRRQHARRLGEDAEPVAHGGPSGIEALGGVGHDLVGVAVAQAGIVEQAPEDLGQVAGAELAAAHLRVLGRQRLGGLGHADGVQLVGRQRQAGVELDQRLVQLGAVVEPAKPGAVVGAGDRQELVAQGVPVAGEGRAQVVADDVGELAVPDLEAVPALRTGQGGEGIGLERRRQVAIHLVDGSLDVDAGGRAPGGQSLPVALGGLVEHAPELAGALQRHGGVLGLGRLQLGGSDQEVGVDPLHLVGRQLGET